jgi:hypothetical protein
MIHILLLAVGWVLALGLALFALVVIVGAWGSLTFRELPLFSDGPEPTTVRVLPEIDLPLGGPEC